MFFPLNDKDLERMRQRPPALDLNVIQWKNPWWYPPADLFWDLVDVYAGKKPKPLADFVNGIAEAIQNPEGMFGKLWRQTHPLVKTPHLNIVDRLMMVRAYTFFRRLPKTDLFFKFQELGWSPQDAAIATLALIGFSQKNISDRMRDLQHRKNIDPFFALLIKILTVTGIVGMAADGQGVGGGGQAPAGQGKGKGKDKGKGQGQGQDDADDDGNGQGQGQGQGQGKNPVQPLHGQTIPGAGAGKAHLTLDFLNMVDQVTKMLREVHLRYKPVEVRNKESKPVTYPADDMEVRAIRDMSEKPLASELALPDEIFDMKALAQTLATFQHFEEVPKSKRFSMLVDVSGSMGGSPYLYAVTTAVALVQNTLRGRHEVILRTFDDQSHAPIKGTPDQVAAYLFTCPFSGGGTNIGAAVATAVRQDDPDEIIVISDGDDSKAIPKPKRKSGEEIPVHVIFIFARGRHGGWGIKDVEQFDIHKTAKTFEIVNPEVPDIDLGAQP